MAAFVELSPKHIGCLKDLAGQPGHFEARKNPLVPQDILLPPYYRDTVVLLHSRGYRRLAEKTQVFSGHPNPHIRSRATHVCEVVTTAGQIARFTGLNQELCESIAWGHDIGHTPFGHLGERVLSEVTGKKFKHEIFGTIVAQEVEKKGNGLNLTRATLLGMRWHSGWNEAPPEVELPLEGKATMMADKIAYTFADVNDAERLGLGDTETMLVKAAEFGESQRLRDAHVMHAIVAESAEEGTLSFEKSEMAQKFKEFRQWMLENIYLPYEPKRKFQAEMLRMSYDFISNHQYFEGCNPAVILALMTDPEVERMVQDMNKSGNMQNSDFNHYGFAEIIPHIRGKEIDFTQPALV